VDQEEAIRVRYADVAAEHWSISVWSSCYNSRGRAERLRGRSSGTENSALVA